MNAQTHTRSCDAPEDSMEEGEAEPQTSSCAATAAATAA
eukprot:CAMPEP_0202755030 /NCGR_PEP_ID=MMETSP1388-20130828/14728_1 /ASSEMBLY_ACC=CAM_ASM_000864 /TAXON_ID=37098 /ORGANISM="Isochrysis sp, Strain CCMP1244" /LENGTH=38 /DNA_ID= /DNA_START= /DNA_END= /DNA_ORIENTATION=